MVWPLRAGFTEGGFYLGKGLDPKKVREMVHTGRCSIPWEGQMSKQNTSIKQQFY